MTRRADLEREIIREWLRRPGDQRTENDVLAFYGELARDRPDLLAFRATGDKYQTLQSILRRHISR